MWQGALLRQHLCAPTEDEGHDEAASQEGKEAGRFKLRAAYANADSRPESRTNMHVESVWSTRRRMVSKSGSG